MSEKFYELCQNNDINIVMMGHDKIRYIISSRDPESPIVDIPL